MASLTDEQKEVIRNTTEGVSLKGVGPLLQGGDPVYGVAQPIRLAPATAELTVGEAGDFWSKHKNKAWVAILLIAGAVGGNVDELYKVIPDVHDVTGLRKEVATLRTDVEGLKKAFIPAPTFRPTTVVPELPGPPPVDDGFRVERPTKQERSFPEQCNSSTKVSETFSLGANPSSGTYRPGRPIGRSRLVQTEKCVSSNLTWGT